MDAEAVHVAVQSGARQFASLGFIVVGPETNDDEIQAAIDAQAHQAIAVPLLDVTVLDKWMRIVPSTIRDAFNWRAHLGTWAIAVGERPPFFAAVNFGADIPTTVATLRQQWHQAKRARCTLLPARATRNGGQAASVPLWVPPWWVTGISSGGQAYLDAFAGITGIVKDELPEILEVAERQWRRFDEANPRCVTCDGDGAEGSYGFAFSIEAPEPARPHVCLAFRWKCVVCAQATVDAVSDPVQLVGASHRSSCVLLTLTHALC